MGSILFWVIAAVVAVVLGAALYVIKKRLIDETPAGKSMYRTDQTSTPITGRYVPAPTVRQTPYTPAPSDNGSYRNPGGSRSVSTSTDTGYRHDDSPPYDSGLSTLAMITAIDNSGGSNDTSYSSGGSDGYSYSSGDTSYSSSDSGGFSGGDSGGGGGGGGGDSF